MHLAGTGEVVQPLSNTLNPLYRGRPFGMVRRENQRAASFRRARWGRANFRSARAWHRRCLPPGVPCPKTIAISPPWRHEEYLHSPEELWRLPDRAFCWPKCARSPKHRSPPQTWRLGYSSFSHLGDSTNRFPLPWNPPLLKAQPVWSRPNFAGTGPRAYEPERANILGRSRGGNKDRKTKVEGRWESGSSAPQPDSKAPGWERRILAGRTSTSLEVEAEEPGSMRQKRGSQRSPSNPPTLEPTQAKSC